MTRPICPKAQVSRSRKLPDESFLEGSLVICLYVIYTCYAILFFYFSHKGVVVCIVVLIDVLLTPHLKDSRKSFELYVC